MGGIDSKLSSTTKGGKRHRSTGGIRKNKRSCIRVNSQHESIKRKGLCKKKGGQNCKTEFAFLEVREYPMILGDNPSCVDGPPVTLDWAHDPHTMFVLDVNTFERMRGERRPMSQMVISRTVREKTLLRVGYSKKEMVNVVRQVRKDKHSRMVSSQQVGMDNVHESVEKLSTGLKKMFVFRKSQYEKTLEASCTS